MNFTSVADIYFISFGLYCYNIIWNILFDVGLVFAMLLYIILETFFSKLESAKGFEDTGYATKSVYLRFFGAIMVIMFAGMPLRPLTVDNVVQYKRSCEMGTFRSASSEAFDDPDFSTSEGRALNSREQILRLSNEEVKIPLLLEMTLRWGTGVSLASVASLPCSINIVKVSNTVNSTTIKDPQLLLDTREFIGQCYNKAMAMSMRENDTSLPWAGDNVDSDENLPWPGHPAFVGSDRYYENVGRGFEAKSAIPGFQGSANNWNNHFWVMEHNARESGLIDCSDNSCMHQTHGFPTCREWWSGVGAGTGGVRVGNVGKGLQDRLYESLDRNLGTESQAREVRTFVSTYSINPRTADHKNELVRLAYFNAESLTRIKNGEMRDYAFDSEAGDGFGTVLSGVTRFMGSLGNVVLAVPKAAGASMIQLAAPLTKAAVLFIIIAALPLLIWASKFKPEFVITTHMFIFSVMLWPFFWEIAILLQQSLVEETLFESTLSLRAITQFNTLTFYYYITDAMFLIFPVAVSSLLGIAGLKMGQTISNSMPDGGAGSIGESGAGKVGGGIKKGAKMAKGGASKAATSKAPD